MLDTKPRAASLEKPFFQHPIPIKLQARGDIVSKGSNAAGYMGGVTQLFTRGSNAAVY